MVFVSRSTNLEQLAFPEIHEQLKNVELAAREELN